MSPMWERVPFSVYSLVSVVVRPVSKNCSCSWSARAPDCSSLLVRSSLLVDQYSPAHFYMGLGETKWYISLYSQLFIRHSRSTQHSKGSVSVIGWVTMITSENVWHYVFNFSLLYPPPSDQQLRFCAIYKYLTDHNITFVFWNYNKPGTSTLALLR